MKQIQPIDYNGNGVIATQLKVQSVNDDLATQCTFCWYLFDDNGTPVDNGSVQCMGADYTAWSGDNNYPYTFVAANIGKVLTLIN
jgi:hypothetical protein